MQAFAPGIYPRSEQLVQATRDLDRGRTPQQAVDERVEGDLAELVSVQQQAGLDLLTDGMLRWQDLFRPLLEASEGLETGALTRFLDTNTFYRAPHATTAAPKLAGSLDERYVAPLPGPRLVTLPSPFALAALGGGPRLALQLTFCDARAPLEQGLGELPVDAIGIDFYGTHLSDVPKGLDKLLLAGVIDARSSTLEDPREIASFAERLQNEREVEEIALVPNGDLQFVSQRIAREKLVRLGAAKTATVEAAA